MRNDTRNSDSNWGDQVKIEATLITAILCSIQTGPKKYFKFVVPSGFGPFDYDEMEILAKSEGVTETQWLFLLAAIEKSVEQLQ